ncbi:MAG: proline dehydrogenase family protein [Chloroflexi bacterium]|nr:proline dehydrogenase family protein [Chloroflexota bacterium]
MGLSKVGWVQRILTRSKMGRRTASRFVAGETPESAIRVIGELNSQGILATLDHLGEDTATRADAEKAAGDILLILDLIDKAGVKSNVSIKLSQIGLLQDEAFCIDQLKRILDKARLYNNFIRLDMEDSSLTDRTLNVYWEMRKHGYDNLGVVIQAYLFRSEADLCELVEDQARVRLCKGAYKEPPQIAFPKKQDVDANYDHLTEILLERVAQEVREKGERGDIDGGKFPPMPAIATHDPLRQQHALEVAERLGLPKSEVEFQMLYGIRRDLQENLVAKGYPVRVYIPYGTQWYPYLMRRLGERPANVWFILSNFFRR